MDIYGIQVGRGVARRTANGARRDRTDAVHPTHAARAVGCWAPKDIPVAITQSSGRERLNIHGAIDLETGNTRMLEVLVVNAASTIMLLMAIEAMYPGKRLIHVFLDNARYHHAKLVQQWLPGQDVGSGPTSSRLPPASRPDRTIRGLLTGIPPTTNAMPASRISVARY